MFVFRLVASQDLFSFVVSEIGGAGAEGIVPFDRAIVEGTAVAAPALAAKGRLQNKAFGLRGF